MTLPRPARWALLLLVLALVGWPLWCATRDPFADADTRDLLTTGVWELDACTYYAAPRMRANGVPVEAPHAFYVVHAATQHAVFRGLGAAFPHDAHRAFRIFTLALWGATTFVVLRRFLLRR